MKRLLLFFVAALTLAGCNTVDRRIAANPAAFAALDPATQDKVKKGVVEIGYDSTTVYLALGEPAEKNRRLTADGADETWIYQTHYQDYAGDVRTGFRRYVVVDPKTGRASIYFEPVYTSVFEERSEERIRVVFKNSKVFALEETKQSP